MTREPAATTLPTAIGGVAAVSAVLLALSLLLLL
jgi:hypothetical protein